MDETFSLRGRSVFVTGASSGLGEHFATVAARSGAKIAIAGRRVDKLTGIAETLKSAGAQGVHAVALDVTDEASVVAALKEAAERIGPLDVIVNNAGIATSGSALDQSVEDFDRLMDTNLRGVWLVATEAARQWVAQKRPGAIINVASILGLRVGTGVAPYAMSKAGVIQMTKALALEWARHNIRVNALAPGYIATPLNEDFFKTEQGQTVIRRVPMRRLGDVGDLDGPFLLLASDASRFMTGAVVAVDGGHLVSSL